MVMIKQHYQEKIRNNITKTLREFFVQNTFQKTKLGKFIKRIKSYFFTFKLDYINKSLIDNYIDQFYLVECPKTTSVFVTNSKIYTLFHTIFQEGNLGPDLNDDELHKYYRFNQIRFFKNTPRTRRVELEKDINVNVKNAYVNMENLLEHN